ncbi:class I SAM-dependent methyltransferase [Propioniciclava flava]
MFGESSREFVSTYPNRGTKLALDLGCGPGHTTRLLAESLRAQRTVGVDQSEVYVQNARARYPNLEFQSLDVTREMPLPPANVIYARFLLSHLPDPLEQVVHWSRHLARAGVALLEETQSIEPLDQGSRPYLELQKSLVDHHGGTLFVGPVLEQLSEIAELEVFHDEIQSVTPPGRLAGRSFSLNLQAWSDDAFVRQLHSPRELDRLKDRVHALTSYGASPVARWSIRQIMIRRRIN